MRRLVTAPKRYRCRTAARAVSCQVPPLHWAHGHASARLPALLLLVAKWALLLAVLPRGLARLASDHGSAGGCQRAVRLNSHRSEKRRGPAGLSGTSADFSASL